MEVFPKNVSMTELKKQLKDHLLSALADKYEEWDPETVNIKEIKTGLSVYFFDIKALDISLRQSKYIFHVISENGKNGSHFARPYFSFDFQDVSIIQEVFSYICDAYQYCLQNQKVENFGCCNYFHECSDALKCLYPSSSEYYRGCIYRRNLEAGRVFYGKNKNC